MSKKVSDLFTQTREYPQALLDKFDNMPDPRSKYIIAITPRSGSSYLCDVLRQSRLFGQPDERLNPGFLPSILKRIPGPTAEIYVRNIFRHSRARNGVSGIKASWFQFRGFNEALADRTSLSGCQYIYLYRRDSVQQAVSLYLATESNVFHTNKSHTKDELQALQRLEYDFGKIDYWHHHILAQERGWKRFFEQNNINPLAITYEDIVDDLPCVLQRLAHHVNVRRKTIDAPATKSLFRKVGDARNQEWACRYRADDFARLQALAANPSPGSTEALADARQSARPPR